VREAGKSFASAVAEVREAVDFLRYYAAQARIGFSNDTHRALGPVVCISPWNFPLAIFTGPGRRRARRRQSGAGQARRADAADRSRTRCAYSTPRRSAQRAASAARPRRNRWRSPGRRPAHSGRRIHRVDEVGRTLQRTLATRLGAGGEPIPLIAETGGQNAMIVDSSALAEQTVADALVSAFDSAGQRCSALRVLCVQDDVADRVLQMLRGAMDELALGSPDDLAIDVGPVIDEEARARIAAHIDAMREKGHSVHQSPEQQRTASVPEHGTFVPPTLIEIGEVRELQREVFGPVLHVLRLPAASLASCSRRSTRWATVLRTAYSRASTRRSTAWPWACRRAMSM
jgi:RHH-type proline utilization regulon transcriptional repressor/proline dehydrogenase/delta 1-pyrroline-5-carboxylate dehydrogenase